LLVEKLYKKAITHRYDDDHIIHYFSYKDFPGLEAEPIAFQTEQGLTIKGNFYHYAQYDKKKLVVFCHGLGGGHRSYMREIERIAREGFRVLACDNIGCFESEGDGIRGLTESLHDLDVCLKYLKSLDETKALDLHVIGHSWGGYAASNILNYHPDLKSVCAISGFCSVKSYLDVFLGGKMKGLQKAIYKIEKSQNPDYVDSTSVTAMEQAKCPVLLVHSTDDTMVKFAGTTGYLQETIHNGNVRYLIVEHKAHNPNLTKPAVDMLNKDLGAYRQLVAKKKLKTMEAKKAYVDKLDFWAMTEQDEAVWAEIFKLWK